MGRNKLFHENEESFCIVYIKLDSYSVIPSKTYIRLSNVAMKDILSISSKYKSKLGSQYSGISFYFKTKRKFNGNIL